MKTISLLAAGLLLCSACGDDSQMQDPNLPSCDEDTRDDMYVAGISKVGEAGYTVSLIDSNPSPPSKGDNIWSIEIADDQGASAAGLDMKVTSYMPDHAHTSPVIPNITDDGDGAYTVDPVNLFMPGYWEVTVVAIDPGATDAADDDVELDTVVFKFCVEG